MPNENMSVTTTIPAPAEAVFAVLADPATHPAIDGTGWVVKPLDDAPLTGTGQTFRMAMYHENHPDGSYEMANRVTEFAPPRTIAWEPGQDRGDGEVRLRRLDLALRPAPTGGSGPTSRCPTTGRRCPRSCVSTSPFRRSAPSTSRTR